MFEIWENYHWLLPPFAAGLLVVVTHVVFGQEVLRRGIIFIDLTIAQMAALGVVLAVLLGFDGGWPVQAFAVAAAVLTALALAWTEKHFSDVQEALIGSVYVVAASVVLLLLAKDPHAGEQLHRLLSGQILWLAWEDVWPVALLYGAILLAWFLSGRKGFYLLFALFLCFFDFVFGFLVFSKLVIFSSTNASKVSFLA